MNKLSILREMLRPPEMPRLCCGTVPMIVPVYYPDTTYKMVSLVCPKCGSRTQAKRFYNDVIREWNDPANMILN